MDRPELREKIEGLLSQYSSELLAWKGWGINAVEKTHDLKVQIAKEIEVLIPDIEKLKGKLIQTNVYYLREIQKNNVEYEAKIEEAKKQEGERIEKQLWKSAYITPTNKQKVINGIKQALKENDD